MLYLFIDKNRIKALHLKKSILGQYETLVFSKTYQSSNLLEQGKIVNIDFVASAVKEALQSLSEREIKDRDTLLILPQESYSFLRIQVPSDIATSAISSFVKDKARSNLPINLDEYSYDYFLEEVTSGKYIHFFAIENTFLTKYKEALQLIELKLRVILPETVTYFKLKQKTLELEQKGVKLNRLILAGTQSEKVRQDTFTKEIGVWTNPLKRIIPEFYQEYLKLLISSSNKPFSVLSYEACVGGFIFHEQHKNFSLLNNAKRRGGRFFTLPKVNFIKKELIIFLGSFIGSFILFMLVSQYKFDFNFAFLQTRVKPTPTVMPTKPTPKLTSTPLPKVNKSQLKIKVLNGSGIKGKASEVKDLLKEKGYQEILTGNADSFDYQQTEIQVKKSKASVTSTVKNDLKENLTSFKESTLDEDEAADIILIIGSD